MRLSLLSSDTDTSPQTLDVSWADHIDGLSKCREVSCPSTTLDKNKNTITTRLCPSLTPGSANKCTARKVEAWSPAVFDGRRGDAHVIGMGCIVLDLDHLKKAEADRVFGEVDRLGWAAILHSTHSHDPENDDHCYRLVIPVTRELARDEVVPTRNWVQAQLGIRADEQTKNLERIYYLPTRPKGGPAYVFASTEGASVEPQQPVIATAKAGFLSQIGGAPFAHGDASAPAASSAPAFSERTNGDLAALRTRALRSTRATEVSKKLLRGEKLEETGADGSRICDITMQTCAGFLAYCLDDASVEALIELGRESIAQMSPPPKGDRMSEWRSKVERACGRKAGEDEAKRQSNAVAAAAFGQLGARAHPDEDGTENPDPFDPARVEKWALKHAGGSMEAFKHQWVVRHHGGNWVFCNGRYDRCIPDKDIEFSVRRDLGRAPLQLMMKDKSGNDTLRPMRHILFDYGTVARAVTASLALRESYYDYKAQTFHEAVCPIRHDLRPKEDHEIGEWLHLFGGDVLLDWVACVSRLDKPAAALYIEGPPGTGKNVLADGLARLWHKGGASAFKDVIGSNFNDSLVQCPLIHADEGIPKTDTIIDDLRRLIGSNVRPLNRKFMPVVSLEGCPRLIITANNDRVLLDTGAQLGPHDIEAVTQRIRQLKATQTAADFLAGLRTERGYSYVESWVKDDKVARHALWLAESRTVDETKRFLVSGDDPAQAEAMITGTGQVGAVMEFLSRYLSDSAAVKTPKVRPGGGRLLVNTEALADRHMWERYVPSRKIPSARLISDSLRAISSGVETVEGMDLFSVKPRMIVNWSRTNQVGSATIIEAKING